MFAIVWMVLLPAALMSAHVGVLLWVWVALLSPNELLVGFMSGVPFNKIVALITLSLVFLSKDKKDLYLDTTLGLLFLLSFIATISYLGAIVSTDATYELYTKILKNIVLSFAIAYVITTRHRIHLLVLVVSISLGFLAVKEGLISILTAGGHKIVGTGGVGDNNSLAAALLMIIPLIYYSSRYSAVRIVRIGLLSALGLTIVTIVATSSRGGFVGLLVLGAFMVKNSRQKFGSLILVALVSILIYALAPDSWFERLSTIEDANNDASFMGRVVAWKISWLIAMDRPFFGGGMHAVQNFLVWDTYKPFLYLLDFVKTPPADDIPHAAHSIYFEVLGDMGFVGLTVFIAILGAALWNCRKIHRLSRGHPSLSWAVDLASMLQITLVIYIVTAAALSLAYFELIYIVIALISRCRRTVELTLESEAAEMLRQQKSAARVAALGSLRPAPTLDSRTRKSGGSQKGLLGAENKR